MTKKLKVIAVSLIIFMFTGVIAEAKPNANRPIASTYKEGIYHFNESAGRKVCLRLITPDKKTNVMIIENKGMNLKYYLSFGENCTKTDMVFESPEDKYTVVIIGEGEIAFTFEQ